MRAFPIRNLKPVVANVDSTEIGSAVTKAQNALFRPQGAVKGGPTLRKLWGFGTLATPFATFDALTHPSGSGTIGAADKTIAVRIYLQGKNFLMFFNMYTGSVTENGVTYNVTPGERGTFYLGDDATYSGDFDPNAAGPPLFEVLAYGLAAHARWYGNFSFGQVEAQNGVDDAVAVQLGRTYTPGKWRKRGSNAIPGTPTISAIEPETASNTQAKRTVTGRAGSVDLVFTANADNFIGVYGNNRIKVRIVYAGAYSAGPITSTITGDGSIGSPYIYTLNTTTTTSSNNAIIAFVATDSKAIPILSASGANATADTFNDASPVFLSGGLGVGASIGLSNEVVTVYARYWDGGYNNCGYEGPSSLISNEIVLDGTTNKDITIQVDIDPTAEDGRFSHSNAGIRIYKQTASDPTIYNCFNPDTPLSNSYRTQHVVGVSAIAPMWQRASAVTATFVGLSNVLTFSSPQTNGNVFICSTAAHSIPTGTKLYVINASGSTGQLSLSAGGAAINIGDEYLATVVSTIAETMSVTGTITNGMVAQTNAPSLGLPAATDMYVISAVTTTGTTTFQLSLSPGGTAIDLTSGGSVVLYFNGASPILELGTLTPDRLYAVDEANYSNLTTTNAGASTITYPSAVTNGDVFILETANSGIPGQAKVYAINASGSTCQLSLYAGGPALTITGSVSLYLRRLTAHAWSTTDIVIMPSGGGAVAPSSLALDTRYYIASLDTDGYGVALSIDRLRVVLALGSTGTALSLKTVAVTMVIGSTTEPGLAMSPDQNRPPPHRYMTLCGTFNWCAGISGNESKIYSSKDATFDEVSPEGVDLTDVDLVSKSRGTSAFKISGLWTDKFKLHVHCADGIVIIDPANTASQQEPLIDAGMVNGMCSSTSDGNKIIFLATNRQMMEFNGARYGNRSSKSKSDSALDYINEYVDVDEMVRSPESCCVLHDTEANIFWMWYPTAAGDNIAFAYDELMDGIVGPFTTPMAITSACKMETSRGQYVVANKDGYIFSWNAFEQFDRGDKFTTTVPTLHDSGEATPQAHEGYASQAVSAYDTDGAAVSGKLWYSTQTILETGMIDLGDGSTIKRFMGVEWRSVSGSRGYVRCTLIDTQGNERSVEYGEMGGKARNLPHRCLINMIDTACKLRFEVFSGDLQPWIARDFQILVG